MKSQPQNMAAAWQNLAGDTPQHRHITPPAEKACPQALSELPVVVQIVVVI